MKFLYTLCLCFTVSILFGQYPVKIDLPGYDEWQWHGSDELPNGDKVFMTHGGGHWKKDTTGSDSQYVWNKVLKRYSADGKVTVVGRMSSVLDNDTLIYTRSFTHFKGKYYALATTAQRGLVLFRITKNGLVLVKDWVELLDGYSREERRDFSAFHMRLEMTVAMDRLYFNGPVEFKPTDKEDGFFYKTQLFEYDGVNEPRSLPIKSNTKWVKEPNEALATPNYLVVRRFINDDNEYYSTFCYVITRSDTFRLDADKYDEFIKSNASLNKFYIEDRGEIYSFDVSSGAKKKILSTGLREFSLSPDDELFFRINHSPPTWGVCDLKNDTAPKWVDVGTVNGVEYNKVAQWYDDHWWVTTAKTIHQLNDGGVKVNEFAKKDLTEKGGTVFKVGEIFMISYQDSLGNNKISTFMKGDKDVSYGMRLASVNRQFPIWALCVNESGYYLLKGDPAIQVKVYDDDNNNGKYDLGELGVKNMSVWFGNELVTTDGYGVATKHYKKAPLKDVGVQLDVDTIRWKLGLNSRQNFSVSKDSIAGLKTIAVGLTRQFTYRVKFAESRTRCRTQKTILLYLENSSKFPMKASAWIKVDSSVKIISFSNLLEKKNDTFFVGHFNLQPGDVLEPVVNTLVGDSLGLKIRNQLQLVIDFDKVAPIKEKIINESKIRCSYDPNDKASTAIGVSKDSFLLKSDTSALEYLIRFQNVGNDTAYNVEIIDQLSEHLDASTFKYLRGSHEPVITISDGRELKFDFRNIMLPDSGANQLGSNGFVSFSIKPKSDLVHRTSITNKAGIYFDFNDPVITNTATDIWVHDMPVDAPRFTSATLKDDITIQLNYKAEDPFTKEVEIHRSINDTLNYSLVSSETNTTTQWLDKSPREDATFYYKLRAVNGVEKSRWSETKSLIYRKSGTNNPEFENMVKVYPNPAQNQLNVQINTEQLGQLILLDISGKQILQQTISGSAVLDVSHLPKGPYMLKISVDGNQMEKMISLQ